MYRVEETVSYDGHIEYKQRPRIYQTEQSYRQYARPRGRFSMRYSEGGYIIRRHYKLVSINPNQWEEIE